MAAPTLPTVIENDCFPGLVEIYEERVRQVHKGRTAIVDDAYRNNELGFAAIALLFAAYRMARHAAQHCPWRYDWGRKIEEGRRRLLVKAGALIAAELDRMTRNSE